MAVLGVLAAVAEAAPPPLPLVLPVPPLPRNSKIYFYEKLKSLKDFQGDFLSIVTIQQELSTFEFWLGPKCKG